jgi:5-methylphenazine-1-carboxylate 1-monooxygenase
MEPGRIAVMGSQANDILIVGGGIGGLTLALSLAAAGFEKRVRVFDVVPEFKPVGGGINLGPHAIRVLSGLGLQQDLLAVSKQPSDYAFFTRLGQLVYREPWGRAAGHEWPHISIHRGELHRILSEALIARAGPESIRLGHKCVRVSQSGDRVSATFVRGDGSERVECSGSILIGCDGVHSLVRNTFYPDEGPPKFHGINLWRGVTRHKPFLTGNSIARVGAMRTTIIIYPIRDSIDEQGNQLVNWVAEVDSDKAAPVDWNGQARLEDFYPVYKNWVFDWIDVAALLRSTDPILSYPMVDRDPLNRWTFGRITLLGDAAHPMFPRGGNGAAQSILDAASFVRHLSQSPDDEVAALQNYEAERRPATTRVVLQNRTAPPNLIVDTVEKLTGGKRFENLDDFVTQEQLREIFESYQKTAGYHVDIVNRRT